MVRNRIARRQIEENESSNVRDAWSIMRDAILLHDGWSVDHAIDAMAKSISTTLYAQKPIVLVVMVGGMLLAGKLLSKLNFPLEVDYVQVSRYEHNTSGGVAKWIVGVPDVVLERSVLVLDDVLDEGVTMDIIRTELYNRYASSVYTAVLVDKVREDREVQADFVGLKASKDDFLFGCGMDIRGFWRNATSIYKIRKALV